MASNLTVFSADNRVLAPNNVFIDQTPVGYTENDGVQYQPSIEKDEFMPDQHNMNIGSVVVKRGGKITFKILEPILANLVAIFDLPASAAIASPLAGDRLNLQCNAIMTKRTIEWFHLGADGVVWHNVIAGEVSGQPQIVTTSKGKLILEVSFDQVLLNSAWPMGFRDIFDAVAAAPTFTIVPLDAAVDVAIAVSPTLTFTKPMSVMALANEHYSFTKDEDDSEVEFAPSFGTRTVGGATVIDPSKIVLNPTSDLTNNKAYTLLVYQNMPAVDGTVLAADVETNFTTVAA